MYGTFNHYESIFLIIMMGDIIMEKKVNRDINAKLLVSAFFWGGSSIAAKILMQYASPPISTFARFGGAAVMLFLIVRIPAGKIKISLNEHIKLAVLGLVGVSLCYYFYFRGLEISSTFNAALFEATTPLLTFLIALICRKESFNKLQFIGLLVAYFGVMVIAAQGNMRNIIEMKFNFGDLLLLASTVCFAVYNILCKEFTTTLSSTLETFYIFAYGTIGLIPWLIMSIRENMKVDLILNIYSIGCIAFLAIGSSAIAYLFFNQGIEKIGASKASECINLVPVIAIILTLIVLKDIPQMYQIVGAIIILLGVYISKKSK